jgi:hypothetical protein
MFVNVIIPKSKTPRPTDKTFPETTPEAIAKISKAALPAFIRLYVSKFVSLILVSKSELFIP